MTDTINAAHLRVRIETAQAEVQAKAKAKAKGRYKGHPEDVKRNAGIADMLARGMSWSTVQATTGYSRTTIAKVAKRAT